MRLSNLLACLTTTAGIGLLVLLPQSGASAQTFDFEELALSNGTTPIVSTQGGVTATITRLDSGQIQIQDTNSAAPFGDRSILPFTGAGSGILINFSVPLTSVSLQGGDFGADDDSPITLTAFSGANGGGVNLGSDAQNYPSSSNLDNGDFVTLSVSAPSILSVTVTNGGPFPGAVYYDNLVVTQLGGQSAPEPATAALLLPLLGLAGLRRRK